MKFWEFFTTFLSGAVVAVGGIVIACVTSPTFKTWLLGIMGGA